MSVEDALKETANALRTYSVYPAVELAAPQNESARNKMDKLVERFRTWM